MKPVVIFGTAEIAQLAHHYFSTDSDSRVVAFTADAAYIDLYRFMALSMTEDAKESHTAWREKRRPTVRGA